MIVNSIVGVIDTALEEAAERGLEQKRARTRGRWERLSALGVASRAEAARLRDAVALRNRLQHAYIDVEPEQLHTGVADLIESYPDYLRVLQRLVELIDPSA